MGPLCCLRLGQNASLTLKNNNSWVQKEHAMFMSYLWNHYLCHSDWWGSVGKDFVYHACGHEFESRLKWKFSNFPHHQWLLLSDYRGMAKWFGAQYNQKVRTSSAVKCGPPVTSIKIFNNYLRDAGNKGRLTGIDLNQLVFQSNNGQPQCDIIRKFGNGTFICISACWFSNHSFCLFNSVTNKKANIC